MHQLMILISRIRTQYDDIYEGYLGPADACRWLRNTLLMAYYAVKDYPELIGESELSLNGIRRVIERNYFYCKEHGTDVGNDFNSLADYLKEEKGLIFKDDDFLLYRSEAYGEYGIIVSGGKIWIKDAFRICMEQLYAYITLAGDVQEEREDGSKREEK